MITVRVQQINFESNEIISIKLYPLDGKLLPIFNSGAHIDFHLPNGKTRQYSLISPLQDRSYYEIAVLKDSQSKGGSKFIHDKLKVGNICTISEPRNLFELDDTNQKVVLFAGGIGITPILSMWSSLALDQRQCDLHYCTRDSSIPFKNRITEFYNKNFFSKYFVYVGNKQNNGFAIDKVLHDYEKNTHIYICGSARFIESIEKNALDLGWDKLYIHKECFKAKEELLDLDPNLQSLLQIKSTGEMIPIYPDQNIAEVLAKAGYEIRLSCEQGICGTCITPYSEGEFYHQDMVLDEIEQQTLFTPCCAKVNSAKVVIDI